MSSDSILAFHANGNEERLGLDPNDCVLNPETYRQFVTDIVDHSFAVFYCTGAKA